MNGKRPLCPRIFAQARVNGIAGVDSGTIYYSTTIKGLETASGESVFLFILLFGVHTSFLGF